jgi:hypothetical protein
MAGPSKYWLDLFTAQTWKEFLDAGGTVSGFRESRRNSVRRLRPGDRLVCYLTGVSRFVGILEVTGPGYTDSSTIWKDDVFPERVPVTVVERLTPETAVPIADLLDRFTWAPKLSSPIAWTGHFRGSPVQMDTADGAMVEAAIREAVANPVARAVDAAKLARRPRGRKSPLGTVTIPEPDTGPDAQPEEDDEPTVGPPSDHTEIQYLLLKLGGDMGLDVWVARNDRSREYRGKRLGDLPRVRRELPLKFDPVTNKTIELIDVLWMRSNAIAAAFEVESTTSIYSGLLRMADLIALQPNLNIPLYIVAPDEKRAKVITEVNRPVFGGMKPPLAEVTRYIGFSALRQRVEQAAPFLRHLKPDFIDEVAETVDVEEE